MHRINVSAKVIADISSGIYRSPANALKELISNAFDADASNVTIRTNRPFYKTITYYDDGDGMSPSDFKWYMSHIGGSRKRAGKKTTTIKGRPLIGKIGIGILAVAQICKSFSVISSKKGSDKKFEAYIDLKGFEEAEAYKSILGDKKVTIGYYETTESKEIKEKSYTKFILHEIRDDFKSDLEDEKMTFQDFSKDQDGILFKGRSFKENDFRKVIDHIHRLSKKEMMKIKDYWRLLWELALYSPIEYFEDGPILKEKVYQTKKKELEDYGLTVDIDGFKLKKPILLPIDKGIDKRGVDYEIYSIDSKKAGINESLLKFKGYLYNQRKQIKNPDLQGILIRIKNVAIGGYDKSYLRCPVSLGPVANFNSGEIYVEYGLEEALNIDRNSFKESHKTYKILQKYVYELMSQVYRDTRVRSKERIAARKAVELDEKRKKVQKSIDWLAKKYNFNTLDIRHNKRKSPDIPIEVSKSNITVFIEHPIFDTRGIDKHLLEKMLVIIELNKIFKFDDDPHYYQNYLSFLKK